MELAERWHAVTSNGSDISGHLGYFVDLVLEHEYRTVIELGVRGGVSTVAWLFGLSQTGGHLWSVDVDPAPFLIDDGWTFIRGNDLEVADQLPDVADIVFVDTCHEFGHTCAEIDLYRSRVRKGGLMLFHDTDAGPEFGVRPALDDRFGPTGWANRPGSNGLGMWSP